MERAGEEGQCFSTATTSSLCPGKSIICNIAIEFKMSICLELHQLLGLHWFLINSNYVHKSGLTCKAEMLKLSQKLGWLGCLFSAHSLDHQLFVGLKLRTEVAVEVSFKMEQHRQPQPCPGKMSAPRAGGAELTVHPPNGFTSGGNDQAWALLKHHQQDTCWNAPQQPVLSLSSLSNEPHKYHLFIYINLVPSINDDKAIN